MSAADGCSEVEQVERSREISRYPVDGLSDVRVAAETDRADREAAERGEDRRAVTYAFLGAVFIEGDVAYPVQLVLDLPVVPDLAGEFGRSCLVGGQARDVVVGVDAHEFVVETRDLSRDLDDLARVREREFIRNGRDADRATGDAAVPAVLLLVLRGKKTPLESFLRLRGGSAGWL